MDCKCKIQLLAFTVVLIALVAPETIHPSKGGARRTGIIKPVESWAQLPPGGRGRDVAVERFARPMYAVQAV